MTSNKYVVKNCPAYLGADCVGFGNGGCDICTDCLIKQVIDRCNISKDYHSRDMFILGKTNMAGNILAYFDIEEVK